MMNQLNGIIYRLQSQQSNFIASSCWTDYKYLHYLLLYKKTSQKKVVLFQGAHVILKIVSFVIILLTIYLPLDILANCKKQVHDLQNHILRIMYF